MKKIIIGISLIVIGGGFSVWFVLYNPSFLPQERLEKRLVQNGIVNQDALYAHVQYLTEITPQRNAKNVDVLNRASSYIERKFKNTGCSMEIQSYKVNDVMYKNIICSFGVEYGERVIIGAHYDVHYDDNPGADDNASGVAGILEIARLLGEKNESNHRIDVIAYTLEELNHFRQSTMGSMMHAKKSTKGKSKYQTYDFCRNDWIFF